MGQEYLSIEATQSMDQIQGASLTYKIALGKYKGKKALTLMVVKKKIAKEKNVPTPLQYA